jgi:hypothetical protein
LGSESYASTLVVLTGKGRKGVIGLWRDLVNKGRATNHLGGALSTGLIVLAVAAVFWGMSSEIRSEETMLGATQSAGDHATKASSDIVPISEPLEMTLRYFDRTAFRRFWADAG